MVDLSLLERRKTPGRRECGEDGLSRGDLGGGMPSPLAPDPARSLGPWLLQNVFRRGRYCSRWPLDLHS